MLFIELTMPEPTLMGEDDDGNEVYSCGCGEPHPETVIQLNPNHIIWYADHAVNTIDGTVLHVSEEAFEITGKIKAAREAMFDV